jgi:hypothetical protein
MGMPMVKCGCCGKEISPLSKSCPQCGQPRRIRSDSWLGFAKILLIAGLAGVAARFDCVGGFLLLGALFIATIVLLFERKGFREELAPDAGSPAPEKPDEEPE